MSASSALIRKASSSDVEDIVQIINAGKLPGQPQSEVQTVFLETYMRVFEVIDADPNHLLMVAENNRNVIGTFHMTFLFYLAGCGRPDAQIEAIHVADSYRRQGLGTKMLRWAIEEASRRHCRRVQLTTDKRRLEAHAFYRRLGFIFSHEGARLYL